MAQLSPVPFRNVLTVVNQWIVTHDWRRWFQELKDRIDLSPVRIGSAAALTGQVATIGPVALVTPSLQTGLYRVSWLLRITQAATVSGSLQIAIFATVGGVVTTQTAAALASNVLGDVQSGSVLVTVDPGTDISYRVTYASVGAAVLTFTSDVYVEALA